MLALLLSYIGHIEKEEPPKAGGSSFYAAFALRTGALHSDFFFKPNACI